MPSKTLDSELKALRISYNHAKSKLSFDKRLRTYGQMCKFFGIIITPEQERILSDKEFINEINILRNRIEADIRKRYERCNELSNAILQEGNNSSNKSDNIQYPEHGDRQEYQIKINPLLPDIRREWKYANIFDDIKTDNTFSEPFDVTFDCSYNPKFEDQQATLLVDEANQVKAARTLFYRFEKLSYRMQLLLAGTGSGKTYILGSFIKNFIKGGWIKKLNCISPWPVLYITKASIVDQTRKVLYEDFGLSPSDVQVVNIEMLRSELGSMFITEEVKVIDGVPRKVHTWNKFMHPVLFVWDECQILAREDAEQTKIAYAVSRIEDEYGAPVIQIDASATPFTRIAEGKQFAIGTKKEVTIGLLTEKLSVHNWSAFAGSLVKECSNPECKATIYSYCEPSVKAFTDYFESHIVRIKGIKPKFKAKNSVMKIHFYTRAEAEEYEMAWVKYQEKKAKLEGESLAGENRMAILAQFTIFRKAAEKIRRHHLAKFAYESWSSGKAPAIACAFKGTITSTYKVLVEDYGWNRDDVSIIWGGSTESLSIKQKLAKASKKNVAFSDALKAAGLNLEELGIDTDIEIKTDEQLAFEKAHNLLTQKPEDRERERIRFQSQKSKLLIFSYKAGGVGLSAHHEAKYPDARPREGIFTPVYSEKELIQALGRLPRITSISDTYQVMCYYARTIEEYSVAPRVIAKLKCMQQVTQGAESWEDIIAYENENVDRVKEALIMDAVEGLDDGNNILGDFGGEVEEQ